MNRLTAQAAVAILATVYVAAATRIGPTVIAPTPTHGVHIRDLIPAAIFVVIATIQPPVRAIIRR